MGTIVNFPNKKPDSKKVKIDDFFVEKLPTSEQYCNSGDLQFTCTECKNVAKFSFSNVVFKSCNFYCGICGSGYKIDNPLFGKNKTGSKNK